MSAEPELGDERGLARSLLRLSAGDLRRPLWFLRTSAELLLESPRLWPRELERLERMREHASRAEEILALLMDEAVAIAGPALPLQVGTCAVAELVAEAIEELQPQLPQRPLRARGSRGLVRCDRARATQLLRCAVKHADEHGARGAGVEISSRCVGDRVQLTVAVDPALRGAAVRGIRLGVAHDIARAHGGSLRVRHERAGRLAITVELPRALRRRARGEGQGSTARPARPVARREGARRR